MQERTTVSGGTLLGERDELLRERERLIDDVSRLEEELARYRAHAQRTSKMFLSVTHYAEWVRENARRDAELALRKARARAEKLGDVEERLGEVERERERAERELLRLEALTSETRAQLSALIASSLHALGDDGKTERGDGPEPAHGDLEETLRHELASVSPSSAPRLEDEGLRDA